MNLEFLVDSKVLFELITESNVVNKMLVHTLVSKCLDWSSENSGHVYCIDTEHSYNKSFGVPGIENSDSYGASEGVENKHLTVTCPTTIDDIFEVLSYLQTLYSLRNEKDALRDPSSIATKDGSFILILNSTFSVPFLPYRSGNVKSLYRKPALTALFRKLVQCSKSSRCKIICLTNLSAQKRKAYREYRVRHYRQSSALHAPSLRRTYGEGEASAEKVEGGGFRNEYLYSTQFPRWFALAEDDYLNDRFLIRMNNPMSQLYETQPLQGDTDCILKAMFRLFNVLPLQNTSLKDHDSLEPLLEKLPLSDSLTMKKQFSTCAPIHCRSVRLSEDFKTKESQEAQVLHEEMFNSLRICRSEMRQWERSRGDETCKKPSILEQSELEVPIWRRTSNTRERPSASTVKILPAFCTHSEMLIATGGYPDV